MTKKDGGGGAFVQTFDFAGKNVTLEACGAKLISTK